MTEFIARPDREANPRAGRAHLFDERKICLFNQCVNVPIQAVMYWYSMDAVQNIQRSASCAILQSRSYTTVRNGRRCARRNWHASHGVRIVCKAASMSARRRWIISTRITRIPACSSTKIISRLFVSPITRAKHVTRFGDDDQVPT